MGGSPDNEVEACGLSGEKKLVEEGKAEEELSELRRLLSEERERAQSYLNRLKYLQADFENYKRRMERIVVEAVDFGSERLVKSLLSVVDELELAIKACEEAKDKEAVLSGVKMVFKKLCEILEGEGLRRIEAIGKVFNPELHEAVLRVEVEGQEDGVIIDEVRRGYMFKGRVIRPSIVKVAYSQSGLGDDFKKHGGDG